LWRPAKQPYGRLASSKQVDAQCQVSTFHTEFSHRQQGRLAAYGKRLRVLLADRSCWCSVYPGGCSSEEPNRFWRAFIPGSRPVEAICRADIGQVQALNLLGEPLWRPAARRDFSDEDAAWIDGVAQRLDVCQSIGTARRRHDRSRTGGRSRPRWRRYGQKIDPRSNSLFGRENSLAETGSPLTVSSATNPSDIASYFWFWQSLE
jgi:hypothetical protein